MDIIRLDGGKALDGSIEIAGAKNACLALLPASLLTDEPITLTNVPGLSDVVTMAHLLRSLGAEVCSMAGGKVAVVSARDIDNTRAAYEIVRKMRASILVLGPLLARCGRAEVSLPGGCAIGARPVDLHLYALGQLGAELELSNGYVKASTSGGLRGGTIRFDCVSVGATENAMMAAVLAKGTTEIANAACEPEIVDLAHCLRAMGARIEGEGTSLIRVEGVEKLHGATHRVIVDRVELGTYMIAAAITGGRLELAGGRRDLIEGFLEVLEASGTTIAETGDGLVASRTKDEINAVDFATAPYPGFPTDLQAQMMALLALANGRSIIRERIFENRFMHVPELARMGASIGLSKGTATVTGVSYLKGAPVMATDLRASASLVLAGLAARGETIIRRVYHIDRGYEHVVGKLAACGARIERVSN